MKKILLGLMLSFGLSGAALAAGPSIPYDQAPKRTNDMAALQNGAKLFVNYCLNCHSAAFMRYNRLRDIGLTEQQIKDNLLFASDKVGDTMKAAISDRDAKEWFGAVPPDLTLVARSRASHAGTGADYLYTYLRTFYRDDTRPTGWNNLAFPNVGMPHVMWELQGQRAAKFVEETDPHNPSAKVHVFEGFEQLTIIDSKLGDRADMWHHDESFLPSPPIVTMTQAQILPPCGGDTCWISMTTAYDALSERMKQYLEGLSAWHDMNAPMTTALRHNAVTHERYLQVVNMARRHLHPMVRVHPVTGRKAIYISPTYTTHIEGLVPAESEAILAYLHAHCQHIRFVYRHRWQPGDMVIWDNRSVIHHAILDYMPHQRRMHRASVFARNAHAE